MARIRTIKPEFWEDEKISKLSIPCRLLFIGCWNFADDQGVFRANPIIIKSKIFPYDNNLRISEIKTWLECLEKARMILPIIHEEESYYIIRTFRNHQIRDKRYNKFIVPQEVINNSLESLGSFREVTPQEKEEEEEKEIKKISTSVDMKEKESDDSSHSPDYFKFHSWLEENAPYCFKHMTTITEKEMDRLKAKYPATEISDVILRIENRKDLRKKYTSLYRTVLNWLKKEHGHTHTAPRQGD